ncbi:hypothetical protein FMEAI12_3350018 [Parafrankia sp. Ea1.12]|nr:hypothetical protein FMEAI12_3350018 [Parafrankia sp. Ea1.12]
MATDGPTTTDTPPPPPPPPPPDTSTREKASALDGRGLSGGAAQDATRPEHESDSARTAEPGTQDKMSPLDGDPTPHEPQNTDQQSPAKQDREPQGLEPPGRGLEPTPEFQSHLDERKAAIEERKAASETRPSDQATEPAVAPERDVESEPAARPGAPPDARNANSEPDASTAPGTRRAPEVPAAREEQPDRTEQPDGREPADAQNIPEQPTASAPGSGPDRPQPSRQEPDVSAGPGTSETPEAPGEEETSSPDVVGDADNRHDPHNDTDVQPEPEPESAEEPRPATEDEGSSVAGNSAPEWASDEVRAGELETDPFDRAEPAAAEASSPHEENVADQNDAERDQVPLGLTQHGQEDAGRGADQISGTTSNEDFSVSGARQEPVVPEGPDALRRAESPDLQHADGRQAHIDDHEVTQSGHVDEPVGTVADQDLQTGPQSEQHLAATTPETQADRNEQPDRRTVASQNETPNSVDGEAPPTASSDNLRSAGELGDPPTASETRSQDAPAAGDHTIKGYTFTVDEHGRTRRATGTLNVDTPDRRDAAAAREARAAGKPGDDAGHLIGHRFNPPEGRINLVPQDMNLNRGAYRSLENKLAQAARDKSVEVDIRVVYPEGSQRPSGIAIRYKIDGETEIVRFRNRAGGR